MRLQTVSRGDEETESVLRHQMHGSLMFRKISHSWPHERSVVIDNNCHINKWWIAMCMWWNKYLSCGAVMTDYHPQGLGGAGDAAVLWGVKADTTEPVAGQKLRRCRCVTILTSQRCSHSSRSHTPTVSLFSTCTLSQSSQKLDPKRESNPTWHQTCAHRSVHLD